MKKTKINSGSLVIEIEEGDDLNTLDWRDMADYLEHIYNNEQPSFDTIRANAEAVAKKICGKFGSYKERTMHKHIARNNS